MDEIDTKIVKILQRNGREQFNRIAKTVGLSNAAVHARVIKLERAGIIKNYSVEIDPKKVGREIDAMIRITVDHSKDDPHKTIQRLMDLPSVISVYTTTGEWDYQIQIVAKNIDDLKETTTTVLKKAVPHLIRSDTSLILLLERKPLSL